jgi:hypothetical protein
VKNSVGVLLRAGANPITKGAGGRSALDWAKAKHMKGYGVTSELLTLLETTSARNVPRVTSK